MKSLMILLIFAYPLFSQLTMMYKIEDEREINHLKGKIKKIKSFQYKTIDYSFRVEKSDFIRGDKSFYIIYDSTNKILEEGYYESESKRSRFQHNIYRNDKLKKITYYNNLNKVSGFAFYKYNKKNNIIQKVYTDSKKNISSRILYNYKNGTLIDERVIDLDNNTDDTFFYEYDKNKNLIKQTRTIMTNKKHIIKLEYDEKNNLILKEQEVAGNKNSKFEYEYDGQNRLIKFKVKILHNNKESVEIINYNKKGDISKINKINLNNDKEEIVYKYRYDKKQNWIERLEYVNGVCENTIIRYFTYF